MTDHYPTEAGPELDVLVAERIMGFTWDEWCPDGPADANGRLKWESHRTLWAPNNGGSYAQRWKKDGRLMTWLCDRPRLPQFSGEIHWAWQVVEKIGLSIHPVQVPGEPFVSKVTDGVTTGNHPQLGWSVTHPCDCKKVFVVSTSAPLAICLGALRAVEELIKQGGYPTPKDWSPKGMLP